VTFRIDYKKKAPITTSRAPLKDLNNAIFPLDCRCLVTKQGKATEYVLGASCKSEVVYVDRDVWTDPCADMFIVLSDVEFMVVKSFSHHGIEVSLHPASLGMQPKRQFGDPAEAFEMVNIDVRHVEGRELKSNQEIVEAGLARKPLVSTTEWTTGSGVHILVEYPVRVWNFNERENCYQLDTGPILFPDDEREHTRFIETFDRAFIAHNSPDWAEFIVNVPTRINDQIVVDHYSEPRRLTQVTNRMIEVIG